MSNDSVPKTKALENKTIKKAKQEEFGNTKGVIRIRKSKKNRQHNGQRKTYIWHTKCKMNPNI